MVDTGWLVEDLMSTALLTVREGDSMASAEETMRLGGLRHVPVVDEHGNLVGIISARDVLGALAEGKRKARVGELMTRQVITVTVSTPVKEAIDLLLENRFGSLPVIGSDGHLVGIVTETDFLRASREAFGAGRPTHPGGEGRGWR